MSSNATEPDTTRAHSISEHTRLGRAASLDRWLPLAAIGITVTLWASAFVAIRHVRHEVGAGALSLGRLLVGALVLGGFVLYRRNRTPAATRRWPTRQDWPLLLICGVLWFGLYNVALNEAERHVDAGTAAMLVNIGPLLIALGAGLLLGEGFPRSLMIGCAIAFAGVIVIGFATSSSGSDPVGIVLCLASAVFYAAGVLSQKPLLAHLPGLHVTWIACLIGTVVCLPFAPALVHDLRHGGDALWWIIYLGAFPTAIGFATWAYALARNSAGRTVAATYLVPPIAIVISWALLGETPAALAVVGGAIALLGVYVARRAPRGPRPTGSRVGRLDQATAGGPDAAGASDAITAEVSASR